jgi:hypothetical protein
VRNSLAVSGWRRCFFRFRRIGEGPDGLARQHHRVHIVVLPIGEAEGREAVGQQHDDIPTTADHIGYLEETPSGSAIGHRPKRQVVTSFAEPVASLAALQALDVGFVQCFGQFGGAQQ